MEVELLKILAGGGGGLVAVIGLIVYVLKYLEKQNEGWGTKINDGMDRMATQFREELKETRISFQDELKETRGTFQTQVTKLADDNQSVHREYREQTQAVVDEYIVICKETVNAVKGLEGAVRELQAKINE